ncbi:hypothetical protein BLNAU_18793 [Blattamonas nauphoetae]|uniref:Uncharacterized protein n=1 Tax=Blattamonas nauphoetae TaxID=2049346 RepID=A0ABQ9X5U2_9EUKA|nr:hypothetical protein BLNAU_18793 [Blattamonas nauphoetae]
MFCSFPAYSEIICQNRDLSLAAFEQTFIDKFINPVKPFLEFTCSNRRQVADSEDCCDFSEMLGAIVQYSPFLEQMTQSVLSSSVALACADCLHLFETNILAILLLEKILFGMTQWTKEDAAVQKRGLQIMVRLCDEGVSDAFEIRIRCEGIDREFWSPIFIGAKLIHLLGGNAPFKWNERSRRRN